MAVAEWALLGDMTLRGSRSVEAVCVCCVCVVWGGGLRL